MSRKRGDNGRYVKTSPDGRGTAKTFRMEIAHLEKLQRTAKDRGVSSADLLKQWIESDCPLSNCLDLSNLKENALRKFQRMEKVGVQSAAYKKAARAIDILLQMIQQSNYS